MMWKYAILIALSAVATNAEDGIWDRAMNLVDNSLERAQRQIEVNANNTNGTNGTSAMSMSIPLPQYAEYPEYFSVDYCSRYHCKCFKFFSSDPNLAQYNNMSWEVSSKSTVRSGCMAMTGAAGKNAEICLWDKRVCNCNDQSFFEQQADGLTGLNFLYPRDFRVFGNFSSESNTSTRQLQAQLNKMRSTRSSSTESVCIFCQNGFYLSGGQCYLESGASPAIVMAIFVLLTTVPTIMGIWYVLHSITDGGSDSLPDYDEKKNY